MTIPFRNRPSEGVTVRSDAQQNRRLILDAAAGLFAEQRLGASVQKIASRAGVSTGTVSRHFPTKADLFEAILNEAWTTSSRSRANAAGRATGARLLRGDRGRRLGGAADRGLAQQLSAGCRHRHAGIGLMTACMSRPGSMSAMTAVLRRGLLAAR